MPCPSSSHGALSTISVMALHNFVINVFNFALLPFQSKSRTNLTIPSVMFFTSLFQSKVLANSSTVVNAPFNPVAQQFLGDYLMISVSHKSFRQRLASGEKQKDFKGSHAGLTPDEVSVPLIVI